MIIDASYKRIIEGILFLTDKPLSIQDLAVILKIEEIEVEILVNELKEIYKPDAYGFYLRHIAGGYQFYASEEVEPFLKEWYQSKPQKLSQAALEVLSIIAYKAPVTRSDVELIRGVNSEGSFKSLLEKGLIEECGRKDSPGRPVLFKTTQTFLTTFGLTSLEDLPKISQAEFQDNLKPHTNIEEEKTCVE